MSKRWTYWGKVNPRDGIDRIRACAELEWTQEAADWWHFNKGRVDGIIDRSQTDIESSLAAESHPVVHKDTHGTYYIRLRRTSKGYALTPKVEATIAPQPLPIVQRDVKECREPVLDKMFTMENDDAWVRMMMRERERYYWVCPITVLSKTPARHRAWFAAWRKFKDRDDSPFCAGENAKREKQLTHYWAARALYTPAICIRPRYKKVHAMPPNYFGLEEWRDKQGCKKPKPRGKYEELIHRCHDNCDCKKDWRPFTTWRPWQHPPKSALWDGWFMEMRARTGFTEPMKHLLPHLKWVLWVFRATAPYDLYKPKRLFFSTRIDPGRRRLQLRSWINGIPQPHRYAKPWECYDFKAVKVHGSDSFEGWGQELNAPVMGKKMAVKVRVNLDYTIVKRAQPLEKKVPGYKLHDGWREIMAYFDSLGKPISRRTAFRKIKEGFRIPTTQVTAQTLTDGAEKAQLAASGNV